MTRYRLRTLPLFVASAVVLVSAIGPAPGQGGADLKPHRMDAKGPTGAVLENLPGDMIIKMSELKEGKLRTRGPDEKANRELFRQVAQFYVFKVTHDQYYTVSDSGELKPKTADQRLELVLEELENRLLIPPADARISGDQMDFIIEFGAALDAAVVAVLKNKTPPAIIRLNAARMLALAAKTGAPAHGKTILDLLTGKFYKPDGTAADTPPEVLYHTLRAAEGFFAANDPRQFGTPRAGYHWLMFRGDDLPDLLALIKALEAMALNGPPIGDKAYTPPVNPALKAAIIDPAKTDPATPAPKVETKAPPTPEQLNLMKYYRRQAVRALAKVRYDTLPLEANAAGKATPAYTLAKIAVADGSIAPTVTAAESIEAAIGLCGILPSQELNMDLVLEAVGKSVRASYAFQSRPETEKTIAWKVYSARLKVALDGWKKNAATNARLRPHLGQINALADMISADILDKVDKDEKAVLTRLDAWVADVSQRDPNRPLFKNDPQSKLNPRDVVAR